MAGLYSFYMDEIRYVILTTDANESMKDVHNRMPLVLPKNEIETWIMDNSATMDLLKRVPPQLIKEAI
jgi:putative SOS response-associated peptidase YedK